MANGNVKEERQFGAWGTLDTFLDSSGGTTFDHQSLLGRGYTGHEHFFGVSLIHMNGRMYDAQLGRFLSPDNYIQQPFNTQNYNRYGYVLNNPLMYTDSSGEFIEYIFAAAVALITGNAIFGNHDATPYDNTYENGGAQSAAPTNNYNNLQSTSSIATKPEIVRPVENFDHPSLQYNPVYGSNGEGFLGTTESGLQGEAIIMDAANFTQGMSDTSALGMGTLFSDFSGSENAMNFIQSHFSNLSNRPDSDGKLTFAEVTKWSNEGSGQPLFVDARKINLNSINTGDFTQNSSTYIDFFGSKNFHPETGPVYGTIKVTLLNPNDGTIKLGARSSLLDVHDFKNSLFSKINDYLYPGNPADFDIYCAPCTTRIKTTAEVNQYWNQIYKVMGERPKF